MIFTGRNEVSAKVIFSQACVMNSVHRGGVPAPNFQGGACSKFSGGCLLQIFGGVPAPNFRGGGVSAPNFQGVPAPNFRGGVCSKFSGGCLLQIFRGGACSKFSGGCLLQIFGGVPAPNFRGGGCLLQILGGSVCSKFSGGGPPIFGIRSPFGRYASYWNAFLLYKKSTDKLSV